ncbi:MAG: hypothetical protein HY040_19800 [Planctomycetes bacterium]|nr:hypothetical protein [Planctomycetota bacterium]
MSERMDPLRYDPRKHNYFRKLMAHREKYPLAPGTIGEVDILHDDWCAIYKGAYCNCEPEVRERLAVERN